MKLWLPTASDGEIAAAISRVVAPWRDRWFIGTPALLCKPQTKASHGDRASELGHVVVSTSAEHEVAAALQALGQQADPANPRDSELLSQLGQAIVADLRRSFEETAGDVDKMGAGELTWWSLALSSESWRIDVGLSTAVLCRIRQSTSGRNRDPEVGALQSAISTETVAVGCHLGSAQITAGELKTLSAGDVIMLDRRHSASVPLAVNGVPAAIGTVRISAGADGPAITLTHPFAFSRNRNLTNARA